MNDSHYLWRIYLLTKGFCSFKMNTCDAFAVIHGHMGRKKGKLWKIWVAWPTHSQLRLNKATVCLFISAFIQKWPEDREQNNIVKEAPALNQFYGVWVPALVPIAKVALGKVLNASESHSLFCEIKENQLELDTFRI